MYDIYKKMVQPPGCIPKILLIMRITTILLISTILQVSANSFAQKISLSEKNVPLIDIFNQIRLQTGYDFAFTASTLKDAKPVSIQVKNQELTDVLDGIFKDQNLGYSIKNKLVVVSKKEPSFLERLASRWAAIDVRGRVVDKDGNGLAGATISVKGGKQSTTSGYNGDFVLRAIESGATLVISYIGYKPYETKAVENLGNVRLEENVGELEEVVINKGYYRTKNELNTGNVSSVKAKVFEKQPVNNPLLALQGQVPGLYLSSTSGIPGAPVNIRLRGQNSLRNGNDPLFIVDGIPFSSESTASLNNFTLTGANGGLSPFTSIPMSDIESIDVLKDADATAIYGSRGANGVILITTKKGKEGKAKFTINAHQGFGEVARKLELMNTEEYLTMRRQALANDNLTIRTTDRDLNGDWGDINKYTDWQDVMIGGTAKLTDIQASITGGNANTRFRIGGAHKNETTVFPGNYRYRISSFNSNINHNSNDNKFKADFSILYSNSNNRVPLSDFTNKILLAPNAPKLYNPDGTLNWQNSMWQNPLFELKFTSTSMTTNLNSSLNISYELYSGITISSRFGYGDIFYEGSNLRPLSEYDPAALLSSKDSQHLFGTNRNRSWIVEPVINFNRNLFSGKIEALFGATFQDNSQNSVRQTATGFPSDVLIRNVGSASSISIPSTSYIKYRYNAIFGRIGYNYQEKYIINLTSRRDASSRFGPGKQFGNFGAIGTAWLFGREIFVQEALPFLSFGKLRASYGVTGNDQLGDYKFLSTYSSDGQNYQGTNGLVPTQLTNPIYGWESVHKLEVGIDVNFLKDRIMLNASTFRNRTGNQLVGYPLPAITGFQIVQANLPAVIQNSGWEMMLNTVNVQKNRFNWSTSVNLSIPNSKLISYPDLSKSSFASRYQIDKPLFLIRKFHFTGIDPNTGLYAIQDLDGDGRISQPLDENLIFIGQRYFGGLNNSFSYKGIQLDVFFQFVKQTGNQPAMFFPPGAFNATLSNQTKWMLEELGKPSPTVQRFTANTASPVALAYYNYSGSDAIVVDASFIRLKNVSLSWDLPKKYTNPIRIQGLNVYIQAQNLFTFTDYSGLDPENSQAYSGSSLLKLPPIKMITAGIQIQL